MREQLHGVDGLDALERLELENDEIRDDQIRVEIADTITLEEHRYRHLCASERCHAVATRSPPLINRLELPGVDVLVHLALFLVGARSSCQG